MCPALGSGNTGGMTTAELDMSFVTTDAEADLTDETRHRSLTGADLHDPKTHASSHQNGGADEISVAGLSGALGDAQTPSAHASSHENGGSDELDLTGLTAASQREVFCPATATSGGAVTIYGQHAAVWLNSGNDKAEMELWVPPDFTTITEAVVVCLCTTTETGVNIDIESDYGAIGEAYNNHSEADTTSTYSFTADQLTEVDVSGILSSLAAGDFAGIEFELKQTLNIYVLGLRFKYT